MSTSTVSGSDSSTTDETPASLRTVVPSLIVAAAIVAASAYGLLADHPYRGVSASTAASARVQDVCSLVVAGLLVFLAQRSSRRTHVVRLGLFGYVTYSYAIYLTGIAMNRMFLVYVALAAVSGTALLDGLARLDPAAWPRTTHRRLERGTGWFLLAVSAVFTSLWLSALLPFAFGGARPGTEGPGGVAYPVFVLDLAVVLPCVAAVGLLLLRGHQAGGPLAVVVLTKIVTLFVALWAGVLVALMSGDDPHLGADAGPSLVMLVVSGWLVRRWLAQYAGGRPPVRTTIWSPEPAVTPRSDAGPGR
jgi:hypothetical protein